MIVELNEQWSLSTDHAASSYGQPVLVHRETRCAYGPKDQVPLDADGRSMAAADLVGQTMTLGPSQPGVGKLITELEEDELQLIEAFVGAPGAQ